MDEYIAEAHLDLLRRPLKEGDCVAVSHRNQLMIATVKKLHPKMVTVKTLGKRSSSHRKYASECVLLEGPAVTVFLLKSQL